MRDDVGEKRAQGVFLGPEAFQTLDATRFERLPLVLRRLTFSTVWRRLRMPIRRRRWDRANRTLAAAYAKADVPEPGYSGLAVAVGELSAPTGLGQAARAYLAEIESSHVAAGGRVLRIDIGARGTSKPEFPAPGAEVARAYLLCQPENYARALGHLSPEQVAGAWRTGTMVWETPQLPRHWEYALDLVHEMWCPTEFCAGAVRRRAPDLPLSVRPYPPYIDRATPALDRSLFDVSPTDFVGIAIMDLQVVPERKNPLGTVIAWKRAFGDDPSKVLLMKIRTGKRTGVVRAEIAELAGSDRGARNVRIIECEFSRAEITGFQRMADVLVSLHRSEGYGLNIRECLELGVPVVATHWSGNTEFGPQYSGYHPIPCRTVPYRDWMGEYTGQRFEWADPDLDAAAAALREIAAARDRSRKAVRV